MFRLLPIIIKYNFETISFLCYIIECIYTTHHEIVWYLVTIWKKKIMKPVLLISSQYACIYIYNVKLFTWLEHSGSR